MTTTILSYNPKDYKSRTYGFDFLNKLIKANIKQTIKKSSYYCHEIVVDSVDLKVANEVLEAFKAARAERNAQFKAGIKLTYAKNKYNVVPLHKTLQRLFPDQTYLPESWSDGRSIQTYDQSDFYSFSFINIRDSKTMNGNWVLCTMLSKKQVFILPMDFLSQIKARMEDLAMEGRTNRYLTEIKLIEVFEAVTKLKTTGAEWKEMFDRKKIFELHEK